MSELRIALRHVLPNTLAPLIVLATAQLGSTILTEASLSFLGLGVPEPHPSWGRMLSESAAEYVRTAPWLVIFPGLAISLAVFGTNLLGRRAARHSRSAAAQLMRRSQSPDAPLPRARPSGRDRCFGLCDEACTTLFLTSAAASSKPSTMCPFRCGRARRWRSSANPAAARAMTALSHHAAGARPPGQIVGGSVTLDGRRPAGARRGGDARACAATRSR